MIKVALATSAAPTFLKAVPNNGYVMVDGGLMGQQPGDERDRRRAGLLRAGSAPDTSAEPRLR